MKLLLGSLIAMMSPVFSATVVVDQFTGSLEGSDAPSIVGKIETPGGTEVISMAQSVTTGVAGYLSRVDLWLSRDEAATGNVVMSILNVDAESGALDEGAPLMTINISAEAIDSSWIGDFAMVSVEVRSWNLLFGAGDVYAIALGAPDAPTVGFVTPAFAWAGDSVGGYANGDRFFRSLPDYAEWTGSEGTSDLMVRTWVEVVPEPSSCAMVMGAGLLVFVRRRR